MKYGSTVAYYHVSILENSISLELFFNTLTDAQEVEQSFGKGIMKTISWEDDLDPENTFVQLTIPSITGDEILSVMQANIIISPAEN
jgi:hypothetical protein